MSKAELRSAMRSARKTYVASLEEVGRWELESALAAHLAPLVAAASIIGAYHPQGSEIDPRRAVQAAPSFAFPSFTPGEPRFAFRAGDCSEIGPHGIPQPVCMVQPVTPDLVIVPLLAVDPAGHRLGQGGGHYDRVLPELRAAGARLIGVGWDLQRLPFALAHEPWDVPLDGFACPSMLELFR